MNLTNEQQQIVNYIKQNKDKEEDLLVLVNSVAGSGKTTLLTAIAATIPHTNSLYLAYNKSVATESQIKFPKTTACKTTHSLAYASTVKQYKLKIGTFSYKDIKERLPYADKCDVVELLREFCLSSYTSYSDFKEKNLHTDAKAAVVQKYLSLMHSAKIECTHEFYLKLFHIGLSDGSIKYQKPFDFVMIDEAGDLNEVTLEIFKLLPSKIKIAVGDKHQNIYSFNHTVNCFDLLQGELFNLSQSFRVPQDIAEQVQTFCRTHLDPSMTFSGIPITDNTIETRGYLTRTNSALVARMIELNKSSTPYGLVRSASEIFKLPLIICSLKYQGTILDPSYRYLQTDIDDWYESPDLVERYKSPLSYLKSIYSEDVQISQAISLVLKYTKKGIIDAFNEAKKHESRQQNFILATAHSVKGLEFDEVVIAEDLNEMVKSMIENEVDPSSSAYIDAMNLYYVACTRCLKSLVNASYL
jgi:superfamily I DNA/RNA helicase